MLRRDGFASMDTRDGAGTLTTRPVSFDGTQLFVNVANADGELRVEILNENDRVIAPFTRENCTPVATDRTLQPVAWHGVANLAVLRTRPVKFRFYLTRGSLYAFWVSPDTSGSSRGYLAAGGPGYEGIVDRAALSVSPRP